MASDLITLERLLDALNKVSVDLEPQESRKYASSIRAASAAVRAYTDRDFNLNTSRTAKVRTFEYDESGYIDIDDCQSVTAVRITFPYGGMPQTLTTDQWALMPYDGEVKDNLVIYSPLSYGMSREMGFTWNLDTYDGPMGGAPPYVEVTAVWGWAAIPEDVQQATVWTSAAFAEDARQVTSESIEGFSRSMNVLAPTALPLRARDLLDQYRKIVV
jgi:hypothetical protein